MKINFYLCCYNILFLQYLQSCMVSTYFGTKRKHHVHHDKHLLGQYCRYIPSNSSHFHCKWCLWSSKATRTQWRHSLEQEHLLTHWYQYTKHHHIYMDALHCGCTNTNNGLNGSIKNKTVLQIRHPSWTASICQVYSHWPCEITYGACMRIYILSSL